MPESERLLLRPVTVADDRAFLDYYLRNRAHLEPWEPSRDDDYYTLARQREILATHVEAAAEGTMHAFAIVPKDRPDRIAGRIALDSIARGVWQNANIGYSIDEDFTGHGYATEAVRAVVDHAFASAGLHRVQAGTMLANTRSQRVLEKAGFRREGVALRYLLINGRWEDHVIFAVTKEEWPARS